MSGEPAEPERRRPAGVGKGEDIQRLKLLEAALSSSGQCAVVVDGQGKLILMNEAGRRLLDIEPSPGVAVLERAALVDLRYLDGRPVPLDQHPISRALRGESVVDLQVVLKIPGKDTWWLSVTASPARDQQGRVIGAIAFFRDITERKKVQDERERLHHEIDAQRRLFQMVIDNVPVAIAVRRGPSFVFELVNPAYQAIAPGREILGRTVAEVWPDAADQILPLLEQVMRTGEPYHATDMPFYLRREPEGPTEERFFTLAYLPMGDEGGKIEALLVVAQETTDHVRARRRVEELAEASQRRTAELQATLENMVEAVFVCDARGRLTHANEAGARLLGMPDPEDVKRVLSDFPEMLRVRHPDGRPVEPREMPLVRALRGEVIPQIDEIIHNALEERDVHVRTSAAPIRDEKGAIIGAVAVARDVTELADLERLKDKFINVAAHELKTPAAIMKGYAQALLRSADDMPSPRRRMLEAIDRGADRIDNIVKDLLDVSRLDLSLLDLSLEPIELAALVREVVGRMALITTRHRIRLVGAEPVVVQGDRDRLEQVVTNLLDNAIRYSPTGGEMDVEVAVRGSEAVVSVRDYGIGIPVEKQARIFERFYRAHTGTPYDYGGMGVGLHISREIVLRHRGRMWFESEEDGGTRFYFSLPLQVEC